VVLLGACEQDISVANTVAEQSPARAQTQYQQHVLSILPVIAHRATELSVNIDGFLKNPDQMNLDNARESWLKLHSQLVGLEVYWNFSTASESTKRLWFDLEAWPLEPGYMDSLPEYPHSGIINDLALTISEAALRSQHGATTSTEVSTGMHAAEYLLWQRSVEDYTPRTELNQVERDNGLNVSELSNNRRREMLGLIARLLVKDLTTLQQKLTDSLEKESPAQLLEPRIAAHKALQAMHRTLTELQQQSTDLHCAYSQSWPEDMQALLQQIALLVDQREGQSSLGSYFPVKGYLVDTMQQLSKLDASDPAQLSAALAMVAGLEIQLDEFFGSSPG
jgi:uncharacterized iron-regulated protein